MAMAVATDEPLMAAKIAVATTPEIASPPGSQPIQVPAASNSDLAMPPPRMNTAASRKNGTATSVGEFR